MTTDRPTQNREFWSIFTAQKVVSCNGAEGIRIFERFGIILYIHYRKPFNPVTSDRSILYKIWRFYIDGFKDLSVWGRNVWIIILIKLFILFVIIRLFFMPDVLKKNFKTDVQRSQHVLENLTTTIL